MINKPLNNHPQQRTDGDGADIFLEVQGYDDPQIYWRLFQEIFTRYVQTVSRKPFAARILFIDKKYGSPEEIVVKYLSDFSMSHYNNV